MYIIGGNMEPENKHYNQVRTLRVQFPVPEIHVKCGGCQKNQTSSLHVDVVTESTTHSVRFLGILSPSIPLPCESM